MCLPCADIMCVHITLWTTPTPYRLLIGLAERLCPINTLTSCSSSLLICKATGRKGGKLNRKSEKCLVLLPHIITLEGVWGRMQAFLKGYHKIPFNLIDCL